MSSSQSDEPQNPVPDPRADQPNKTLELKDPDQESGDSSVTNEENENQTEEDEGECGFCLFMKGGGCKEVFINWEKCIEEGEKNKEDIVDKCFQVTSVLKKCMEANSDYYGPILQAEKAAEQEAINQLNKEKDAATASNSDAAAASNQEAAAALDPEAAAASVSREEKQKVASS